MAPSPTSLINQHSPEAPLDIWEWCWGPCCAPVLRLQLPQGLQDTQQCHRGCPGSQTGVETQIEQAGQSHTGHDTAGTATGFPQHGPGPKNGKHSVLCLFPSTVIICATLQLLLQRSDLSQGKLLPGNKDNLKLQAKFALQGKKICKMHANAQTRHTVSGHCRTQVQFLNWSELVATTRWEPMHVHTLTEM